MTNNLVKLTMFRTTLLIWIFQGLENDLTALDDQIKTIVEKGQALADAGHFDRAGILKAVDSFHKR